MQGRLTCIDGQNVRYGKAKLQVINEKHLDNREQTTMNGKADLQVGNIRPIDV